LISGESVGFVAQRIALDLRAAANITAHHRVEKTKSFTLSAGLDGGGRFMSNGRRYDF